MTTLTDTNRPALFDLDGAVEAINDALIEPNVRLQLVEPDHVEYQQDAFRKFRDVLSEWREFDKRAKFTITDSQGRELGFFEYERYWQGADDLGRDDFIELMQMQLRFPFVLRDGTSLAGYSGKRARVKRGDEPTSTVALKIDHVPRAPTLFCQFGTTFGWRISDLSDTMVDELFR
ncbi:hypothetical protein [Cerasicoccus fimbriatus]|uniref:hypothetical protein n=1 Tax=Cerasicoccus fimbriatus TaxID=3014554 RepID=UPI0022B3DAD0|nr:hypothetical protein [Cerasicoccus sp. TK19100]